MKTIFFDHPDQLARRIRSPWLRNFHVFDPEEDGHDKGIEQINGEEDDVEDVEDDEDYEDNEFVDNEAVIDVQETRQKPEVYCGEVTMKPSRVYDNKPIVVGQAILQHSKLLLLKFVYFLGLYFLFFL